MDFSRQSGSGEWGGLIGRTSRAPIRWRQFTASFAPIVNLLQLEILHAILGFHVLYSCLRDLDLTPKVEILAIDSRYREHRELSIKEGKKTLLRNGSRSRTGATMRVHCGMSLQIMTIAIN